MPETLYHNDFSAGWCPSDDQVNGRPNALLQMDNVELDRNGALQLIHGTLVVQSGYPALAHTMFSRFINGTRHDYCALTNGAVYRDNASIISGGDTSNAAFGTAFNFVLICSGTQRFKDTGSALVQLGVNPPTVAPTATQSLSNAPYALINQSIYYGLIGSSPGLVQVAGSSSNAGGTNYLNLTTNSGPGAGIINPNTVIIQSYGNTVQDLTTFSPAPGTASHGYSTDDDFVTFNGYTKNPFGMSLQFDILLAVPDSAGDIVSDYYTYTVQDISKQANFNAYSGAFTIRMARRDFQRVGGGIQDWSTTYGFRLTIIGAPTTDVNVWGSGYAQPIIMQGGSNAQFGTYQYVQVNVNNTGSYLAKSIAGPPSKVITINGNCAQITPQNPTSIDPQANEAWIYRRSVEGNGNLGDWYRVLVFTAAGGWVPQYDIMSDQAALELDITINPQLVSIQSITDKIFDIIGPIQGRWFYFTTNFMYPSDINDPDLVNPSIAVRTCGSNSEMHMWARNVSASVVLVGTSVDGYLLTGTFSTFPDGTIDIYYQSLGVKFPPITYDAAIYGGAVYYFGSDGWRVVTPTSFGTTYSSQNNQLIVAPNLDRLYKNEQCYSYALPVYPTSPGAARFPICISKNKLWCFINGTGRGEIYDFMRQYWRTYNYNLGTASACCSTQDGKILAFYPDMKMREIDYAGSKKIDGITNQGYSMLFPYKDNKIPRQRKDTYTFKTRCYTSTGSIQVSITDEKGNVATPGMVIQSPTTSTECFLDLSQSLELAGLLPKSYMVKIFGYSDDLYVEDWSIDYDPRPVPLTYLRVPSVNYGTTARKRIYTIPFQIDTLGHPVLVTPTVDGAVYPALIVNSTRKQSFDYEFLLSEFGYLGNQVVGRDYDWAINGQGSEFEFWGFQEIRNIEIFPDPQACYVIPKSNFGSAVQKRFRTWPFVIDTHGQNVTFQALVDNQDGGTSIFNTSSERATVFHYFTTDVFGIDYGGTFTDPSGLLEIWSAPGIGGQSGQGLLPDSVENLPIMHEYDQVGPIEIFRFGKIVRMALRCLSNGPSIPFKVFIGDNMIYSGNFNVNVGKEDEYIVDLPKGVSGTILRVELGPCGFTFSRYFMKFQVAISASQQDTELKWITVPGVSSYMAGGI